MAQDIAAELAAIKTLQETLEPLDAEARNRVIGYVFGALGITPHQAPVVPAATLGLTTPLPAAPSKPAFAGTTDILTLKEQKQPSSGTQMIVVMAYYLAHLAPEGERRDYITSEDIQKYFVQAKYPLPGSQPQALVHAKNAGYLDFVEKGKYRLNSVGHNLVAHKMPKDGAAPRKQSTTTKKKTAKKAAKKTKKR